MGCGFSRRVVPNGSVDHVDGSEVGTDVVLGDESDGTKLSAPKKDLPLSFEVPFRDEESLIRRHPPVRLYRLEEQQRTQRSNLTLEELNRRQIEADERRRRILDSRILSAQNFQRKIRSEVATESVGGAAASNGDEETATTATVRLGVGADAESTTTLDEIVERGAKANGSSDAAR